MNSMQQTPKLQYKKYTNVEKKLKLWGEKSIFEAYFVHLCLYFYLKFQSSVNLTISQILIISLVYWLLPTHNY